MIFQRQFIPFLGTILLLSVGAEPIMLSVMCSSCSAAEVIVCKLADLDAKAKDQTLVEVEATVNNFDNLWRHLYVQDGEERCFVEITDGLAEQRLQLYRGDRVRITGIFQENGTRIQANKIEKVDFSVSLVPNTIEWDSIQPGDHWLDFCECSGRVESILVAERYFQLLLKNGSIRYLARFRQAISRDEALALIGAEIEFVGTISYLIDNFNEPSCLISHVMPEDKITVLTDRREQLGEPLKTTVSEIETAFKPNQQDIFQVRAQIAHISQSGNALVEELGDPSTTLLVNSRFESDYIPGDIVELLLRRNEDSQPIEIWPGYMQGELPGIPSSHWDAVLIVRDYGLNLASLNVTAPDVLSDPEISRARLTGMLVGIESMGNLRTLRLVSQGVPFSAVVEAADREFAQLNLDTARGIAVEGAVLREDKNRSFSLELANLESLNVVENWSGESRIEMIPLLIATFSALLFAVGFVALLTRKNRGRKALASAVARLNTTFDAVREGILVTDACGNVVAANSQSAKILGISATDIFGGTSAHSRSLETQMGLLFHDSQGFLKLWLSAHSDSEAVVTREFKTIDSPPRTLLVYSAPVNCEETDIGSRIWCFDDVSQQKRLEADLVQSQKIDAIGRLAGGIAHDFNNLLLAINANLELAMMHPDRNIKDASEYIVAAERAVDRASRLVKHLLGFSRKTNLELRTQNPKQTIERLQRLVQRILDARISLTWDLQKDCWNAKLDETHLEQVLLNLCLNARDALNSSTGQIAVSTKNISSEEFRQLSESSKSLSELPVQDYVCIQVRDNGVGIQEEIQAKIFDPFFTTKASGKGTGLGLSMSFGIIRQHNGMITCESQVGKGATLSVFLPRTTEEPNLSEPSAGALPFVGSKQGRILIADDDELVCASTMNALKAQGFVVKSANNGLDALIYLRLGQKFDLAILDLSMPAMSGKDVVKTLEAEMPDLPVIISSGYQNELGELVGEFGNKSNIYPLVKPFQLRTLLETIAQALEASASTNATSVVPMPKLIQHTLPKKGVGQNETLRNENKKLNESE